jgi:hypothetical protein
MGYPVEEKKDTVVKAALPASEKTLTSPKGIDQSVSGQASAEIIIEASAKVYFQIED